jgi:dTDP-glucose 4,6-dehydratase
VTGGAGFIGSNFVLEAVLQRGFRVINLDKLTYAGSLANLAPLEGNALHTFVRGDIADRPLTARLLAEHTPDAVVHLAAESHVDRSINAPADFVTTNVVGTFELLEAVRAHLATRSSSERASFRFLHVSTDEVYGSLGPTGAFTEDSPYAPNSPYASSKASSDLFVRAYHRTYGLPTLTTHCSNNYGPRQFPEKLIPLIIAHALEGKALPVYGDGQNVRDWIFVEDHVEALLRVLEAGTPGETYCIGGRCEWTNLDLVRRICSELDILAPPSENPALVRAGVRSYHELVTFVEDRLGHDRRYAMDPQKAERTLGIKARHTFDQGLTKTLRPLRVRPDAAPPVLQRWRDIPCSESGSAAHGAR